MIHQIALPAEILYATTIGVIKVSTLLLFARIFPNQKLKRIFWAVGLFISTYITITVFIMAFQCNPVNGFWNLTIKSECVDISKLGIVVGSLNVLTDFLLLCLPLPQLWKLQMRRGTKLQLTCIFSIGSLSVTQLSFVSCADRRNINEFEKRAG